MAIPVIYNLRSVKERWTSAIVAVLGIAGTVGVFIAVLSLAKGFKATLVSSGSPDNAIVRRAGSTSEMDSNFPLDQVKIWRMRREWHAPEGRALVSPEVVLIAPFPLQSQPAQMQTCRFAASRQAPWKSAKDKDGGRPLFSSLASMKWSWAEM